MTLKENIERLPRRIEYLGGQVLRPRHWTSMVCCLLERLPVPDETVELEAEAVTV